MGLLSPTEGCDFDLYLITGGCSVAVPVCAAAHSWLLYDYNVTMAGRVRAARVRCRRSSLRGVVGSDRRRRRVLLRLVRGGRGRGSAAPSFDLKAGAVGGVVGGHVLLYHSMQVQHVRQCFYCLRCCYTRFSRWAS